MNDTALTTDTEKSTGNCWPPLAHIARLAPGEAPKEGDYAICGAKLMGIDLRGMDTPKVCKKCIEIAKRLS